MLESCEGKSSVELVKESVKFLGFDCCESDPERKNVSDFLKKVDKDSLLDLVYACEGKIEELASILSDEHKPLYFDIKVDLGERALIYRVYFKKYTKQFGGNPIAIGIVFDKAWGLIRLNYISGIFDLGNVPESYSRRGAVPISTLAGRLNVGPKTQFDNLKRFNPMHVNGVIDSNIRQFIRLINVSGIETYQSCGGHRLCNKRSNVFFPESELREVVSLMLAWKIAGGMEWGIRPCPDIFMSYVELVAPKNASVDFEHKDLDGLTDFLCGSFDNPNVGKLTFGEIIHSIKRRIRPYLMI